MAACTLTQRATRAWPPEGSGDVLTGILTSLLAQNYSPEDAARLGVYQHGIAGDRASRARSKVSMIASDIVENLGW